MKLKNIRRDRNENNREYVFRVLKENIMNLNINPGSTITEGDIGEILNVSRTPIREAIVRLSEDRLLNVYPQKGSFVSKIDLDVVSESLFMRKTMEKEVLRLLVESDNLDTLIKNLEKNLHFQKILYKMDEDLHEFFHLDNEFHKLIFVACGKERVWESIQHFNTHYDRLRLLDALEKATLDKALTQHEEILQTLKDRDPHKIDEIIHNHLSNFKEIIGELKSKYPDYFQKKLS